MEIIFETTCSSTLFDEEMPPTLLTLYENDPAIFMDILLNRKKNTGLFDVSKSLDEDFVKALDMISFIVSRHPKFLNEREVYHILMRTYNPEESQINLNREILDKLEKMLKNPRYKTQVKSLKNGLYFKNLSESLSTIFKF
jgi:hypothetical protein